jgi:hypothetical protein
MTLNLQKLSKELDDQLAKETPESLRKWLDEKEKKSPMPEKCINVREMLTEHLRANGYDGLLSESHDCACQLDDLIPCMEDCSFCKPAHYVPCDDPNECEFGDSPTHFHMEPGPNSPQEREGK